MSHISDIWSLFNSDINMGAGMGLQKGHVTTELGAMFNIESCPKMFKGDA